jgi:type IV pilus assembly protein PilN
MIRINLLPVRASKKRELGRQWIIFFGVLVLGTALGNYLWLSSTESKVADIRKIIAKNRTENAELEKIIGEVKDIKKEKDDIRQKLGVLNKLKAGRLGQVKVMDELSTIIPAHVWLTNWEETGGVVSIQGAGTSHEEVANFMRKLRESKYFENVTLKNDRMVSDHEYDFSISCNVKYTA